MSASSNVAICNRALQKVGEGQIMSLTDDSTRATECSRLYIPALEKLQREIAWNFCKKRASLAALSAAPTFGFAYQYNLPSDFLRLLDVQIYEPWSLEGGRILTDASSPLQIIYVAKITETAKFDSMFAELLAAYIAVELCEVFTQSRAKKEQLLQEYDYLLKKATATDGREQHPMALDESEWLDSRW